MTNCVSEVRVDLKIDLLTSEEPLKCILLGLNIDTKSKSEKEVSILYHLQ